MTSYIQTNTSGELNGYPGLHHLAEQVVSMIPISVGVYVEPFAGLGRTAEIIQSPLDPHTYGQMVLNDMSDYALDYLRPRFPDAETTKEDFADCILRWDTPTTFFMLDPPYRTHTYADNEAAFADRKDIQYYKDIIDILPRIEGDWLVCADATRAGRIFEKTNWPRTHLYSKKNVIFGKKAHIQVITKREPKP